MSVLCADPESFAIQSQTLKTFFSLMREEGSEYHIICRPSLTRQRNAIEMVFSWRTDDGPRSNAGSVALRILRISGNPDQYC